MGKLLVVDDDEALRRLMGLELGDTYEVIGSGQPEEGLALALEHKPDAILLDLRMPKYSGYELCRLFRKAGRLRGAQDMPEQNRERPALHSAKRGTRPVADLAEAAGQRRSRKSV